jgi:hypothetical protein
LGTNRLQSRAGRAVTSKRINTIDPPHSYSDRARGADLRLFVHVPAGYPVASAPMLWAYVVDGVVVPLAGLGDFPGLFRSRHVARTPAVADLPGCKDEASRWLKGKKERAGEIRRFAFRSGRCWGTLRALEPLGKNMMRYLSRFFERHGLGRR